MRMQPRTNEATTHLVEKCEPILAVTMCRHVTIDNRGLLSLQSRQLVEMSCENSDASNLLDDVLGNRLGQAVPVESGRAAAELVDDDETSFGRRSQYRGRLQHLRHERADPAILCVPRPHAGEEVVNDVDLGGRARDEAPDLRHGHNGGEGAYVSRFSAHVRASYELERRRSEDEIKVVCNEVHVWCALGM